MSGGELEWHKKGRIVAAVAIVLVSVSLASQSLGRDGSEAIKTFPQDIQFKGLVGAAQTAVLFGDPNKPGLYVMRVRYPKGLKVKPHSHPDGPRTTVVLSGTLYYAFGDRWDESKLEPLRAGTFFTEPANAPHYVWAKDDDVIIQLTSIGPTRVTPVPQPNQSPATEPESGSSP